MTHWRVQEAVDAFVKYLYEDELDGRMHAQDTVALLHIAHFFGAPHLVGGHCPLVSHFAL